MRQSEAVDIEELRQNLGDYLRRAEAGERIVVVDGDRPVAELAAPVRVPMERMIEEGKVQAPRRSLSELPEPLPINEDDPYIATRALEEVRGYR